MAWTFKDLYWIQMFAWTRVLNCWCIYKSLHFPVAPHPFPFGGGSGWRGGGGKATGQTIMRLICRENVCPVNRWRNYWVYQRTCCTFIGNHLHRPIIIANLAIQQHFPIQILLVFLRFKLLPIYILMVRASNLAVLLIFSCSFYFCYSRSAGY